MVSIGVYYGNEEWVLRGIGIDLSRELRKFKNVFVDQTEEVFNCKRLKTDYHVFVQQGQLNINCEDRPENVPDGSICLFTHLDIYNFKPELLSRCKAVIFNSSIQLSMAIANGYVPTNAYLRPHAVDPSLHQVLSDDDNRLLNLVKEIKKTGRDFQPKTAVGFCGRYWEKITYTRRKNYDKIKKVAYSLAESGIPVVALGPGWDRFFERKHPKILTIEAKYLNYPLVYNLMKIFVSLSIHEGGPLPVLESMCCGAYPIVTNTGFAFDVLRDSQDGIILDPFKSPTDFSDVIQNQYFSGNWDSMSLRKRASEFSFNSLASLIVKISLNNS